MSQLHKRFTDSQIKELFRRYCDKELKRKYIQDIIGIKERRFFKLLKEFKHDPENFSIQYSRATPNNKISSDIEQNILNELSKEQKLIRDKDISITCYNYSYVKDILKDDDKQIVSVPTIISRAKANGFYLKPLKRKSHDREVITNHVGEMTQHDFSYHKFTPYVKNRWCLITSIDDFSRFMLYAQIVEKESSWAHILAVESAFFKYGVPVLIYADSHSIFRFVRGRDSFWYNHHKLTDDVDPQWKQVIKDCNVKVTYALSPQAKGKVERPYRWIQDRLVRTCARNNISDIKQVRRELLKLVNNYNYKWVHSTTGEIPYIRFQRAMKENQSLYRDFSLKPPFLSTKDIFCFRVDRTIDAYRRISLDKIIFKPNNAVPYENVTLRISPINKVAAEVRFWCDEKLIDIQRAKIKDLKSVHF